MIINEKNRKNLYMYVIRIRMLHFQFNFYSEIALHSINNCLNLPLSSKRAVSSPPPIQFPFINTLGTFLNIRIHLESIWGVYTVKNKSYLLASGTDF